MKKAMSNNTAAAKRILKENGYTCVLYSDNAEYHSEKRGVQPLIEFLESGMDFRGFCAADKTVGLGAAHLYVLLGVRSLWASVMSRAAKTLLEKHNIDAFCENEVPYIINRAGDGICPIENAVTDISCSTQALSVIRETLKNLRDKK